MKIMGLNKTAYGGCTGGGGMGPRVKPQGKPTFRRSRGDNRETGKKQPGRKEEKQECHMAEEKKIFQKG